MNELFKEIAEMTESKTENGHVLRIPEGQKIYHMGFTPITFQKLRDRFACDKIQKELDEAVYRQGIIRNGHNPDKCQILDRRDWRAIGEVSVHYKRIMFSIFGRNFFSGRCLGDGKAQWKTCTVKIEHIDKYTNDKIPERCLESLQKAMEKGLKWETFRVAYPVIEDVPQTDPILLSVFGWENTGSPEKNIYIEIDFWE